MRRGLVRSLRAHGFDVLTAREADRLGLPDESHLEFATAQGRTIYTVNVDDFARIHARWLSAGLSHAGVILLSDQGMDVGNQLGALTRLASELDSATMRDRVQFLANWLDR